MRSLLAIARFTPALKMPVFIYAGWIRYPFSKYLATLTALTVLQLAVAWTLLHLTPEDRLSFTWIAANTIGVYLLLFLIFRGVIFIARYKSFSFLHVKKNFFSLLRYHNRQYWPLWLLYVPLYLYMPVLGLKHRSCWAWLWVNPSLPSGGWWGEKKSDLDAVLRKWMPEQYLGGGLIDLEVVKKLSLQDQDRYWAAFPFPLVVKPDQGRQGSGVKVVENIVELKASVAAGPMFFQTFDASPYEAGLMFYRDRKTNRLTFFSMTDKHFPKIIGDGRANFLQLLLRDKKARYQASLFLAQSQYKFSHIFPLGEVYTLTTLGSHSKGAHFFSEPSLVSTTLLSILQDTLGKVEGLDFGRLDIKYSSPDTLRAGEFKVIELNGAGAESTNIHDPRFSIFEVYQILFRQWDVLFSLGKTKERGWLPSIKKLRSFY